MLADVRFGSKADIHYSISSSARVSTSRGRVRPSVLAVFRLIRSSNLGRLINRDVARFGSFENLVHVIGHAPEQFCEIDGITQRDDPMSALRHPPPPPPTHPTPPP